jgi:hypothetical protein
MEATISPFLKIPLKIRHMIYRLLLVHQKPINRDHALDASKNLLPVDPLAILQVCRQIYMKAEEVFYTSNKFFFPRYISDSLSLFLTSISDRAYLMVARIDFDWPDWPNKHHEFVDLLTGCKGLKELTISNHWPGIPTRQMRILKGLRIRSFEFDRRKCDANREFSSLIKTITGGSPKTRAQSNRAAERRSKKVSHLGLRIKNLSQLFTGRTVQRGMVAEE